jgi:hypothetical protein
MDTDGRINALGRQYIGAVSPNTTVDYIPGVVSGGDGEQPGDDDSTGNSSPTTSVLPSALGPLAVALFVVLLI